MSFSLLVAAGAGVVSPEVPARPVCHDHLPSRFTALGTYDAPVVCEASPTVVGDDWYQVGTIPVGGGYLDLVGPVERIRARTVGGMGGFANVYWTPGD